MSPSIGGQQAMMSASVAVTKRDQLLGDCVNALTRIVILVAALAAVSCANEPPPQPAPQPISPPDTRAADEAAIRSAIREWAAAAKAKDAEKFASFYAGDGVIMFAGAPDVRGSASIREAIMGLMKDPAFALSFEPDAVVVARSGDLAYETGSYEMTATGPNKKPSTENGHYVVVWRKQADGAWKVALDVPVSDPPAPATPAAR